VTPVATLTAHLVYDANAAVAAVRVSVAACKPESEPATVNVVLPHPDVVGVDNEPNVNCGNTINILSDGAICAFRENSIVTEEAASVTGFISVSVACCAITGSP
jgi:hypothetical protein